MIEQVIQMVTILSDMKIHSGNSLGEHLGVTRAAVWKLIKKMQDEFGVDVRSIAGSGYQLVHPIDLIDKQQIDRLLSAATPLSSPINITVLDSCTSTNDEAMVGAQSGASSLSVWISEHQRAGRGRRGKQWMSPLLGNIYCSILWRTTGGVQSLEGLSLVIGIAIAQALEKMGVSRVKLKWPNDIWVDDKKLGGILIEIVGDPIGQCAVVIGFGLNIRLNPTMKSGVTQEIISLTEEIGEVNRNETITLIIREIAVYLENHSRNGFSSFLDQWSHFDALIGREVIVASVVESIAGRCEGVSPRGALLLNVNGELQEIYAGEISVRPS